MVKQSIALLLLVLAMLVSQAANLESYRWQNRLLVLFLPQTPGSELAAARAFIEQHQSDMDARDLRVITVNANEQGELREQFEVSEKSLTFVLIGKDGGEKARQVEWLDLPAMLELIDTMPMRRREIAARAPVIGGPCQGCELVYQDMPGALSAQGRIATASEPGEPMRIDGTVRTSDGTPARDVIVYAYQTNAEGIYPDGSNRHGRLRGWARTDASGHYRFDTIRPGAYPGRSIPEHVHMHIIEPGVGTYYIDDIIFADDALLTPAHLKRMRRGRGGAGLSEPGRDNAGVWRVRRDITLGENIPDYRR